jgi:hypothetical protein
VGDQLNTWAGWSAGLGCGRAERRLSRRRSARIQSGCKGRSTRIRANVLKPRNLLAPRPVSRLSRGGSHDEAPRANICLGDSARAGLSVRGGQRRIYRSAVASDPRAALVPGDRSRRGANWAAEACPNSIEDGAEGARAGGILGLLRHAHVRRRRRPLIGPPNRLERAVGRGLRTHECGAAPKADAASRAQQLVGGPRKQSAAKDFLSRPGEGICQESAENARSSLHFCCQAIPAIKADGNVRAATPAPVRRPAML